MKILLFSLLLFFVISCEQKELMYEEIAGANTCGTTFTKQEPEWLKSKTEEESKPLTDDYCHLFAVNRGIYKGETVFLTYVGGALCCTCAGGTAYNCEGEVIFSCNLEEEAKIKDKKVIWMRDKI